MVTAVLSPQIPVSGRHSKEAQGSHARLPWVGGPMAPKQPLMQEASSERFPQALQAECPLLWFVNEDLRTFTTERGGKAEWKP